MSPSARNTLLGITFTLTEIWLCTYTLYSRETQTLFLHPILNYACARRCWSPTSVANRAEAAKPELPDVKTIQKPSSPTPDIYYWHHLIPQRHLSLEKGGKRWEDPTQDKISRNFQELFLGELLLRPTNLCNWHFFMAYRRIKKQEWVPSSDWYIDGHFRPCWYRDNHGRTNCSVSAD